MVNLNIETIFIREADETMKNLKVSLKIMDIYINTLEEYVELIENNCFPDGSIVFQEKSVATHALKFREFLISIENVVEVLFLSAKLENIVIGGVHCKSSQAELDEIQSDIKIIFNNFISIPSTNFHVYYELTVEFKKSSAILEDVQINLANNIVEELQKCSNIESFTKILKVFRPTFPNNLVRKYVCQQFGSLQDFMHQELNNVVVAIKNNKKDLKSTKIIHHPNLTKVAGVIKWTMEMKNEIEIHQRLINQASGYLNRESLDCEEKLNEKCYQVMETLTMYADELYFNWAEGVEASYKEELTLPILTIDPTNGAFAINFSSKVLFLISIFN
ncbi:Dynein heavy chain 17, axonemal [Nymphon striatum]|nr:Dynein heavy chain 17, axonemal [Nymphon striatum]